MTTHRTAVNEIRFERPYRICGRNRRYTGEMNYRWRTESGHTGFIQSSNRVAPEERWAARTGRITATGRTRKDAVRAVLRSIGVSVAAKQN